MAKPAMGGNNPEDMRMRYAVAEVVALSHGWRTSRRPPQAYIAEAARNVMRDRQREDDGEHIRARRQGFNLISPQALGSEGAEIVDSPVDALAPIHTELMPRIEDLEAILDTEELDPSVRRFCKARLRGVKRQEISQADRSMFRRQMQKLRELIAARTSRAGYPSSISSSGINIHRERFFSGAATWSYISHEED
jgi:hypothetical protein